MFDAFVKYGIILAYNIRKGPKELKSNPEKYVVLSDKNEEYFKRVLKGNVIVQSELNDVSNSSEVIFDADYVSYKDIIRHMSNSEINSKATFKIHPKNANFILGSNDSKNRGEVIKL